MNRSALAFLAVVTAVGSVASAAIDNLSIVVPAALATGGNAFGAFVYVAGTNTIYTGTFGAGGSFRRINNVDGAQTLDIIATEGEIQLFYRDGDPTRGVSNPTMSGMILNPAAVGPIGANGGIWIMNNVTTRFPNVTTVDPAASKKFYRYNFGTIPSGGDGRDIFSTTATLAQFQAAANGTTNTSNNVGGRKAAFSPTGQTIYAIDSSSAFGGLYAIDPLGTNVTRILDVSGSGTGTTLINTEPGVLRVDNKDRVFFRGNQIASGTNYNVGGINYVDYDGTTISSQQTFLAAADLRSFLEVPESTVTDVRTITFGSDDTMYFYDQETTRLLARDSQGRLYKVATRAERDLALTGSTTTTPLPTATVVRLQTREVTHPTAGAITQLLYAESSPLNSVGGAFIFKPTDFDRDGDQDAADLDLLEPVLKARGVASSLDDARFDLNGNGVIDWKDVKIAQTFQTFENGDTNFSFGVDFDDLLSVAQNYGLGTDRVWTHGDFDGDNDVDFDDLLVVAQSYDVPELHDYSNISSSPSFASDWALAQSMVPEPTSIAGLAMVGMVLRRRRA